MGLARSILLAGSQSTFLRERARRYKFVRKGVSRFMPGESLSDAIAAAQTLRQQGLATVFTKLGENVTHKSEATAVRDHYIDCLAQIRAAALPTEISVKPTQLGLDLSPDLCFENLCAIYEAAGPASMVWMDMESSPYVDPTLGLIRRALEKYRNVGICLQAYLLRTAQDVPDLLHRGAGIRLVKGAYAEPATVAFADKKQVDANYVAITDVLLRAAAQQGNRVALGTHDRAIIAHAESFATANDVPKNAFEFEMLYGIQRGEQERLARAGWRSTVLVSYGDYWFPWFMRRLAERPANVGFLVRNFFN